MFYRNGFIGGSLPPKTLCLTFDDGPGVPLPDGTGSHTVELAQYLQQQGIPATFFCIGKYAALHSDVLSQVRDCGHLLGNHTFDHPHLPDLLTSGGDVFSEVAYTDGYIRQWMNDPTVFLRPPGGDWTPDVATACNENLATCLSHIGPIQWDVDGSDWACWQDGTTPEACAQRYVDAAEKNGQKGVVLMHDCLADPTVWPKMYTFAMVQMLVPMLRNLGYNFVRLDAIPELQAITQVPLQFALMASNGAYISPQGGGGGQILVNATAIGTQETLSISNLGYDKVALMSPSGLYLSAQDGGGVDKEVLANCWPDSLGDWERFDLITVGRGKVAFRTVAGYFLTRESEDGGRLMASSPWIREREIFTSKLMMVDDR